MLCSIVFLCFNTRKYASASENNNNFFSLPYSFVLWLDTVLVFISKELYKLNIQATTWPKNRSLLFFCI